MSWWLFWRDIKARYELSRKEVRELQVEVAKAVIEGGEPKINDRGAFVSVNDLIIFKRTDDLSEEKG